MNVILEVAISMALLYSMLSVIVSGINEYINHLTKKRGKFLLFALEEVFKDSGTGVNYTARLFRNPLIDRLKKDDKALPQYISGVQFSEALISVMVEEYDTKKFIYSDTPNANGTFDLVPAMPLVEDAFQKFKYAVQNMPKGDVEQLLQSFLNGTDDYDKLKINIQNWYNDYM